MITSVGGLKWARDRWLSAGRDPSLFDIAINVLHAATTNIDVLRALPAPPFTVRTVHGADDHPELWRIYANGDAMLDYELREAAADADVTVMSRLPEQSRSEPAVSD
jgi:hypothetical protein